MFYSSKILKNFSTASQNGLAEISNALISAKANVNIGDYNSKTPLMFGNWDVSFIYI
jgi:ankyrin repeat protein